MKKGNLICCVVVVLIICLLGFGGGCESDAQTGGLIGALAGAGIGQLAGGSTEATLIGAAVGGTAGYIIGDQQAEAKTQAELDKLRQEMNMVFVNITNSNNSISHVGLRKQGVGYVGPKGEYYNYLPTAAKLEPIYAF